jgi:hypothetical protein
MTTTRYEVFVSSTYADLMEERSAVIQALMGMDCIPAGMELFPAADEEQFHFIKRIIDDCDYYILIIGGRYGSVTSEGISYTEKEYDYARGKGMKVLAFVHDAPGKIPLEKSEGDEEKRKKLDAFREKVKTGSIVKMWHDAAQLPGLVAISLSHTIRTYPAIGWVRADAVAQSDALKDLNNLRKSLDVARVKNDELEHAIRQLSAPPETARLAGLADVIKVTGTYGRNGYTKSDWALKLSFGEVFALIAPYLLDNPTDQGVENKFDVVLRDLYQERTGREPINFSLDPQLYQTFKIQFMALNLVTVERNRTVNGSVGLFWSLTGFGRNTLIELRTIKRNQQVEA